MPTRVCVKVAYEYGPNWTKTCEGPAGLASPRWSCAYEDALGRTIAETRTGFRGSLLVTSNEYNTANQLVAIRDYNAGLFTLGVPDEEVRQDLCLLMAGVAANKDTYWASEMAESY